MHSLDFSVRWCIDECGRVSVRKGTFVSALQVKIIQRQVAVHYQPSQVIRQTVDAKIRVVSELHAVEESKKCMTG